METKLVKESILRLENRNQLSLTGVEKVISFSPTQILLVCQGANLQILGEMLNTSKLDNGEIAVDGVINSIKFTEKREKLSLLKRIFK